MADEVVAKRLRIHGRVQGVWYRGWMVQEAIRLGLAGWVRNRRDGTVEAVISGPDERVREMERRCHQGPPSAEVGRIETSPEPAPPDSGFRQRPTM